MTDLLQRTSLYAAHVEAGAKMVPFAGYDMPVQYPSGIIKEHLHTRAKAGLFDVSHMGQIALRCPLADLAKLVPGDLAALAPMQTLYSLLLNTQGGVIDDLMITRLDSAGENWFLVVNASRKHVDLAHLRARLPAAESISLHPTQALIALQGPGAVSVMERFCSGAARLAFMNAGEYEIPRFGKIFITRSGYTGEDGFEISIAARAAADFWRKLLAEEEVAPAGLGARDTLRLEAGLCLYGHELDETISPVEAALNWVIGQPRRAAQDFPGAHRIMNEMQSGAPRRRVGLMLEGKAIAREHTPVENESGQVIGQVSSGSFAPSLDAAIAMAYIETASAVAGNQVVVPLRGRKIPARIVKMPFVPHRYVRKTS
ncbi:MAG: glycine cleavage system aminomethyltransferase GcvT [Alphaproteobacteria bacterium]